MKVVMTLLARDEADILDAQITFHINAGVDFVIATEHRSMDGTREILESYEREGCLHLIREDGADLRQDEWVTRMAFLAARDFGADWVIYSDADEFWWPRGATFREVLAAVPARFGLVLGVWRHFVLRPHLTGPFWQDMVVRARTARYAEPYWPTWLKVVHRAHEEAVVAWGNHDVRGPGLTLLREWIPFEILHFPVRSIEQMVRKFRIGAAPHAVAMADAMDAGSEERVFWNLLAEDEAVARGLADGSLVVDTRLRDLMRVSGGKRHPAFPLPSLRDDVLLAEEFDLLQYRDSVVRLGRIIEQFEQRLSSIEATLTVASGRKLERGVRSLRRVG